MNLGLRFHDTAVLPLEQRIRSVRAQGFSCVQLALSKAVPEYASGNGALTPGYGMYLKKLFAKHELDIAVLGCYLNLLHPDGEILRQTQETYRAHIRFAAALGCGMVGTETGSPNAGYVYEPAGHTQACFDRFVENIRPVVRYAEQMGVILGVEPVFDHTIYTAQRARQLLDTLDSPNVQIIWDPVNLLNRENCAQYPALMEEFIRLLGADIAAVHLKDFIAVDGGFTSAAPCGGGMKYTRLLEYLIQEKPFIHVLLEETTPENAAAIRLELEQASHIQK